MSMITPGGKLIHVQAPNYVNEPVDQLVGLTYNSGAEHRFSMTFGRDQLHLTGETLKEISPGIFQTQAMPDDYSLTRIDFATFTMNMESAIRFRDALTQMIEAAQAATPATPL